MSTLIRKGTYFLLVDLSLPLPVFSSSSVLVLSGSFSKKAYSASGGKREFDERGRVLREQEESGRGVNTMIVWNENTRL